jgi:hypothetical protein
MKRAIFLGLGILFITNVFASTGGNVEYRGTCKTAVLQVQPLKNACFAAFRRETARAFAKLTEFCKRLYILQ